MTNLKIQFEAVLSSDVLTEVIWKTANYGIHALNFSVWHSHMNKILILILISAYSFLLCYPLFFSIPTNYFWRRFERYDFE